MIHRTVLFADMKVMTANTVMPMRGASAGFSSLFSVFQHLIDTVSTSMLILLNGDWPFINAVAGLMSPASTHPCFVCDVHHHHLLQRGRSRSPINNPSSSSPPLLRIDVRCIVPLPLHAFLGISNKIIFEVLTKTCGFAPVYAVIKSEKVKVRHSRGCSGLQDLDDMNGNELTTWLKKDCCEKLIHYCQSAPSTTSSSTRIISSATVTKIRKMNEWMKQLHHFCMSSSDWAADNVAQFHSFFTGLHGKWKEVTDNASFIPKLHLLHHIYEFAQLHEMIGRVSESHIEHIHSQINSLYHNNHRNCSKANESERLRRCLADFIVKAVQSELF